MASAFVVGYSILALFPTYLQKDLGLNAALVALPVFLQNFGVFSVRPGLGLGGRSHRPPPGNHYPGLGGDSACARSPHQRLHDDRRVFACKGRSAPAVSTSSIRPILPKGSPPKYGRRQAVLSITRERSSAVWWDLFLPTLRPAGIR